MAFSCTGEVKSHKHFSLNEKNGLLSYASSLFNKSIMLHAHYAIYVGLLLLNNVCICARRCDSHILFLCQVECVRDEDDDDDGDNGE